MIHIDIPDFGVLNLEHIVLDYNGTLAVDGVPIEGVKATLRHLAGQLTVHVLTADTFGRVKTEMADVPCIVTVLGAGQQDRAKEAYVRQLGADTVVAVGNGRNDRRMLRAAALGVAVILAEGAAGLTLLEADVVATDILSTLELLIRPLRLVATLRS
ncbi:MAG: ATPase P [Pseudomonadota bacterium]